MVVAGNCRVRFQNKGELLLWRRAVSSLAKRRPSPSFDRVARQQSPTDWEDTRRTLLVKSLGKQRVEE